MRSPPRRRGFTLIELLVVVMIIGILAGIAVQKYGELLRKADEGATKGNLGSLRSALTVYYSNLEGVYPSDLAAVTVGSAYIKAIPVVGVPPYHADANAVADSVDDASGWYYNNSAADADFGRLFVNCTHTDMKGSVWTSY